jgi:hypothetical protein
MLFAGIVSLLSLLAESQEHLNVDVVVRPVGARACMPHPAHVLVAMTASERGLRASEPKGVCEELTVTLNGVDGTMYELRISLTQEPVAYVHKAIAIPSLAHRPLPCIKDKPTTLCLDIRVPWPAGIAGEVEFEATFYYKFPNLAEQETFLTSLTRTLALSSRPAED